MPEISQDGSGGPSTITRDLPRGNRGSWHTHDVDQLLYPASGVLSALTESATWVLPSPERALYVPAGTPHSHAPTPRRTRFHALLLPPGFRPDPDRRPHVIKVSPLLRELLTLLTQPMPPGGRRDRLLAVAADELSTPAQPVLKLPRPADPRLAAAARAIQADPAGATLAKLADAAGVSTRTLSRLVADQLGLTVPFWRTQYRLAESLLCLLDDLSVTATAHHCGWHNASSYIAGFHTTFGMTPRVYQQSARPSHDNGGRYGTINHAADSDSSHRDDR